MEELVGSGCDVILQSGTNLALSDYAAEASALLGSPVLTMNGMTRKAIRRRVA